MDSTSFYEEYLNDILQQLVESKQLEPNQEHVTKFVIDNIYNSLSEKQRNVFNYMINTIKNAKAMRSAQEEKEKALGQTLSPEQYNNYEKNKETRQETMK
ncbi:MAG: hypothetical protein LBV74_14850 [Tannerella sp.]|jgi:HD superfamily phosphohydrolase|nr:hypothetical protein [Tannerella sp.]